MFRISADDIDFATENKLKKKALSTAHKEREQSALLAMAGSPLFAMCDGSVTLFTSALTLIGEGATVDDAFLEAARAHAQDRARAYPRQPAKRIPLRVELRCAPDEGLRGMLARDGFTCAAVTAAGPFAYYGEGDLEQYRAWVFAPDVVEKSVFASNVRKTADAPPQTSAPASSPSGSTVASPTAGAQIPHPDGSRADRTIRVDKILRKQAFADLVGGILAKRGPADEAELIDGLLEASGRLRFTTVTRDGIVKALATLVEKRDLVRNADGRYSAISSSGQSLPTDTSRKEETLDETPPPDGSETPGIGESRPPLKPVMSKENGTPGTSDTAITTGLASDQADTDAIRVLHPLAINGTPRLADAASGSLDGATGDAPGDATDDTPGDATVSGSLDRAADDTAMIVVHKPQSPDEANSAVLGIDGPDGGPDTAQGAGGRGASAALKALEELNQLVGLGGSSG